MIMNILLHGWDIQKIKCAPSLSRCTRPYPFQMHVLFFSSMGFSVKIHLLIHQVSISTTVLSIKVSK